MISSHIQAWFVSIGVTVSLYFLFLSLIFPRIRAARHLQERWVQFGKGAVEKWEKTSKKIDDRRLRSLQIQSKLKNILAHPYPSLKKIEHLLYRSSFFSHVKTHIAIQTIGIAVATEIIFVFSKIPLANSFILGFFVSMVIHYFFLRSQEAKWKKSFILTFPDALDLITRGLKSGMTLGRGIAIVSEETPDPVGHEFNYMASQLQLGINPTNVLTEAASRIGVDEFRFFSLALIIQREMGGSLADILGKLSEVIRERARFRKKVMTLSAESKATAVIVGSLPVFLGITVEFLNPGYLKFFFTDPKGKMMLWICVGLSLMGTFVIRRLMRLES